MTVVCCFRGDGATPVPRRVVGEFRATSEGALVGVMMMLLVLFPLLFFFERGWRKEGGARFPMGQDKFEKISKNTFVTFSGG